MYEAGPKKQRLLSVLLGVLFLFPYLFLFLLSFSGRSRWPEIPFGDFNFSRLQFLGPTYGIGPSLKLSLLISGLVAVIATPLGFVAAKAAAHSKHRKLWIFAAFAPYAMSPVILGTCLMFGYIKLGLDATVIGVVLSHLTFAVAYAVVFFVPFWDRRLQAFEQLVYTFGGGKRQAYFRVFLPMAKPMLILCLFQTFIISWFQYGLTLLIGGGKIATLPLKVFEFVNEANPHYAALASCLLVLPPVIMLWIGKRFWNLGKKRGSKKSGAL